MKPGRTRILLVDDHALVRAGLGAILRAQSDLEVVAEAVDGAQAVGEYRRHRPDVVVMDLELPDMDGVQATRLIRQEVPDARILMLTASEAGDDVSRALQAGARAYLHKGVPPHELLEAIRKVDAGELVSYQTAAARDRAQPESVLDGSLGHEPAGLAGRVAEGGRQVPSPAEDARRGIASRADSAFLDAAKRVPFLRDLGVSDRESIRAAVSCTRLRAGEAAWTQGERADRVAFVLGGHVKLVMSDAAGKETVKEICRPGQVLCAAASKFRCCSAVAVEEAVEVLWVPWSALSGLLDRSPRAGRALMREMAKRERRLRNRIWELTAGPVEQRVAVLLLRLADETGVARHDGVWIPLSITRAEFAALLGTTAETVVRTTRRLLRDGVLGLARRGFLVRDRARLEELATKRPSATPGPGPTIAA